MKEITTSKLLQQLNSGEKLSMIDVREYAEIKETGKIPGAKHIPLGELGRRLNEIDKNNQEYIIICRSGNRSKAAAGLLKSLGYNVKNLIGGMSNWEGQVE